MQFDAVTIEGALLPAEWPGRIAALEGPAQTPADYAVPKGLQLRDEIGRYWRIAEALWVEFAAARGISGAQEFVRQLLVGVFGVVDLTAGGLRQVGGRQFPLAFAGVSGRLPVVVGAPDEDLDQSVARHGDGQRRRSAFGALQEYLNAADDALWGVATNGLLLRLGRDNVSLTRPAWLEADLERIFQEQRFADFSVLWLILHASRFGRAGQPVQECPLEVWRVAGQQEGSRARDQLRVGVEQALLEMGQGFVEHPANEALRAALADGTLAPEDYFNELLRLVYRTIFLLTVEERGILHAPTPTTPEARRAHDDAVGLYADGYGLRRLRERALRRAAHDRHTDLWESLKPVFTALGRAGGEPALALPGLGGLFAAEQCPNLDASALANERLLAAVFHLAWLRERGALARVNWKDMGAEEFGSVYESLLELVPHVAEGGRSFAFMGETAGNARKLTGSYYTPDALVQQLLDTALEPVVAQRLGAQPGDPEQAILSMAVVDPACGSGHFLLAAARRLATHLARHRAGGTPGAVEYRHALRDVVTHCVHGVDRNPMALELARMALWLEAYTPDRALGFLDHHLVCGDALLGLLEMSVVRDGIPDDAFKALPGDDKEVAKELAKRNRSGRKLLGRIRLGQQTLELGAGGLVARFAALDALADDSVAGVEAKRKQYLALHGEAEHSPLALAADCFLAAFLAPKTLTTRDAVPTTAALASALDGTMPETHELSRLARRVCRDARVLHWPLAFPQPFSRGGFDVVLGNPPWEVSQLNEEEFFAVRAPEVAERSGARRKQAIAALQADNPILWQAYTEAKFRFEASNAAIRGNPRFGLSAIGKLNTYPLFAETAHRLAGQMGRAGIVLPTGIATDDSTKKLFNLFVESQRIVSLIGFDNAKRIFPAIHPDTPFCLLTLGRAGGSSEFLFYALRPEEAFQPQRRFSLSPDDFRLINPNTRTCPVFRSRYDAELTKKIYSRVPVFVNETLSADQGNTWDVSFVQGMFNMTSDSGLFLDRPTSDSVALYEAKMIHQFDHRWATYEVAQANNSSASSRDVANAEKVDAAFIVQPRYWVERAEVEAWLTQRGYSKGWLMGWRDITNATNERTVIASVLPPRGVGNNLPLMLFGDRDDPRQWAAVLGNLNAIVVDYVARQKVGGTHLNFFVYKQLPVLSPAQYSDADLNFITPRVLELTYTARDLTDWARDLGYDRSPFEWNLGRRAQLRAELDACYARLYGLARDELRYVLDPSDVMGTDYPSETFRVLKESEERQFGEYRTRRLLLEAWDRLFGD